MLCKRFYECLTFASSPSGRLVSVNVVDSGMDGFLATGIRVVKVTQSSSAVDGVGLYTCFAIWYEEQREGKL